MLSWRRPDADRMRQLIERQSRLDFTYDCVGATRGEMPAGFESDHAQVELGRGAEVFARAQQALRQWCHFQIGWAEAWPADTPLEPGQTVAVRAKLHGLWALAACRVVYTVDETSEGGERRFGYAYGTLPEHPEQGEERFLIVMDADGNTRYQVLAFFRPNRWWIRLGWPYFRIVFNGFRQASTQAMRDAVQSRS